LASIMTPILGRIDDMMGGAGGSQPRDMATFPPG
jgi:hypothetical protein